VVLGATNFSVASGDFLIEQANSVGFVSTNPHDSLIEGEPLADVRSLNHEKGSQCRSLPRPVDSLWDSILL